jgi:hypothetical protein
MDNWSLAFAQYAAASYQDAVATLSDVSLPPSGYLSILAASLAKLGRWEEAAKVARRFLVVSPGFSANAWARTQLFRRVGDAPHFLDGYALAGLPGLNVARAAFKTRAGNADPARSAPARQSDPPSRRTPSRWRRRTTSARRREVHIRSSRKGRKVRAAFARNERAAAARWPPNAAFFGPTSSRRMDRQGTGDLRAWRLGST